MRVDVPKEVQFLLDVLNLEQGESVRKKIVEGAGAIDWTRFMQYARHHRVSPVVYVTLKRNFPDLVPEAVLAKLHRSYVKNTFQMLNLTRDMGRLCEAFQRENVRMLVLKGPALAHELYGDVSLRPSKDLDILVSEEQLTQAESILKDLGFEHIQEFPRILEEWRWRAHHLTYVHPLNQTQIELHWKLNPEAGKEPAFEELWGRRRKCTIGGANVFILGKVDEFINLIIHGSRHAWFRIRWLSDIDRLARGRVDWKAVSETLPEYEADTMLGQTLFLCQKLFHTPVPERMKGLLSERAKRLAEKCMYYFTDTFNLHSTESKQVMKRFKRYVFSTMSMKQRLIYILVRLYPSSSDAELVPLPRSLHFLYFPLRPFLWVWRHYIKTSITEKREFGKERKTA